MKKRLMISFLFVLMFILCMPGMLLAAEAGKFLFVFGDVFVEQSGQKAVKAKKGMALHEGSKINSAKNGKAQIRLKDGGFLAVRPNTELVIDEYAFNEQGRDNKGVVSLIKGTFRTISGAIAKDSPESVVVKTPVATIGIRGTDHEPAYIPPGAAGFPANVKPGLYDKVNAGATVISNDGGELFLGPAQVGFVGEFNEPPVKLEAVPNFYQQPNEAFAVDVEGEDEAGDQPQEQQEQAQDEAGQEASDESSEEGESLTGDSDSPDAEDNETGDAGVSGDDADPAADAEGNDAVSPDINESGATVESASSGVAGDGVSSQVDAATGNELVTVVEATDSAGNTIDATNQTFTDSSGNTVPVEDINDQALVVAVSFIQFDPTAGSQSAQTNYDPYQRIEETHLANSLREAVLRSPSGHVIGAEEGGVRHEVTGIISQTAIKQSNHYVENGIEMGMLSASTLYSSDVAWDQTGNLENRYWGWITGPIYLGGPITGSVNMNFDGGLAYEGMLDGSAWVPVAFNSTGNNLVVDFTNQKVDLNLSVGDWRFTSGMSLNSGEFNAQLGNVDVTYASGSPTQAFGAISGSLVGSADGAIVSFAAKETSGASIDFCSSCMGVTGVAAFDRP